MTGPGEPGAAKSSDAFRTIGELSADLGVPQHVLRYWEGRFPQLRPVQRAGKRRYYRPDDVALVRRIHRLLTVEGYTVRGVQQMLAKGGGVDAPAAVAPPPASAPEPSPPAAAPSPAPALGGDDVRALRRVRDMLAVALAED